MKLKGPTPGVWIWKSIYLCLHDEVEGCAQGGSRDRLKGWVQGRGSGVGSGGNQGALTGWTQGLDSKGGLKAGAQGLASRGGLNGRAVGVGSGCV